MEKLYTSFKEFSNVFENTIEDVNEGFLLTKRRRGESQAEYVSTNAPVRTKVLGFIDEKEKVSKEELMEFFNSLQEDIGRVPSWGWLRKNAHLIDSELDENGDTFYYLTKRGKRVLETYKNFEKLTNAYNNSEESKKQEILKAKEILKANGIKTLDENASED